MSLATPLKLQRLQEALYTKAKQAPAYRFYLPYDKVHRADILAHAYALAKQNGGAPGVDGETFEDIEAAGVSHYFDTIPHADLMKSLARRISDRKMLQLLTLRACEFWAGWRRDRLLPPSELARSLSEKTRPAAPRRRPFGVPRSSAGFARATCFGGRFGRGAEPPSEFSLGAFES